MDPYLEVRDIFLKSWKPGNMTWEEWVGWYLANSHCHVHKTPEYFVMARPVVKAAGAPAILDCRVRFCANQCDTWYLFAFAGDRAKAWRHMPYPLQWLCWQKHWDEENDLRFVPTSRISELSGTNA